jgi:hypothetical protein
MAHYFQVSQTVFCMHLHCTVRGNHPPRLFPNNSIIITIPRDIILSEKSSLYFPAVTPRK